MKKIIVILVAACFFINIIGYHLIFYLRQAAIKNEMKQAIRMQGGTVDETDFVFLLSDHHAMKQIRWEGDDEFSLDGEMYDVIERKVENNQIVIRALADEKETALLEKASGNWNENEKCNKTASELYQLLQTLFYQSNTAEVSLIKPLNDISYFLSSALPLRVKKIPTPPPQVWFS